MPELPEVEVVVKILKSKLINKKIIDVFVNNDKLLKNSSKLSFVKKIKNKTILNFNRIGKYIIFILNDDNSLISHLRMEGKYRIEKNKYIFRKHDHIIFELENNQYLIYNDTRAFGTFHLSTYDYKNEDYISKLGFEPIDINPENLFKIFKKRKTSIKNVLLDQTIISGLGNIYVNEVLFIAKIDPEKPANEISILETKKIVDESIKIFSKSIENGGSSISTYSSVNDKKGSFSKYLLVHNRLNKKCKICKSIIKKKKIGGRGTYYCEVCQN